MHTEPRALHVGRDDFTDFGVLEHDDSVKRCAHERLLERRCGLLLHRIRDADPRAGDFETRTRDCDLVLAVLDVGLRGLQSCARRHDASGHAVAFRLRRVEGVL